MFRKTWLHLRLLGRLTAWCAGALGCLFVLAKATPLALELAVPYIGALPDSYTLFGTFFCLLSVIGLVWIWPSFVRRSLSIDSSWLRILMWSGLILICFIGLGLAIATATDRFSPTWVWVLVCAAVCALACLALPRLVVSFLRRGTFARDVLALGFNLRAVWAARLLIGIGLVSAIALPNYLRFVSRSRTSEARINLEAIRTAEEAHFNEHGTYLAAHPHPRNAPGPAKTPWRLREDERVPGFDLLGWAPEAEVHCRYGVAVAHRGGRATAFTAEAICDFDGDGVHSSWGYVQPAPGSAIGIPGPFAACPSIGTYDHESRQHRLKRVGPCDEKSGRTVF